MGFQLENSKRQKKSTASSRSINNLLQKEISFSNPFSNKIKENFYTELSVLLKAGIPLKEALTLLENTQKKKAVKTKAIINKLATDIVNGLSLSDTIHLSPNFTDYEYYSINIGEETGTLIHVTEQLGSFYSGKNEQRRQLINALTYPIIIFSTAFLVVAFMLSFVVPMFQEIFKQQGVPLPLITRLIIAASEFAKNYGSLFVVAIILLLILRSIVKKKLWYRKTKDKLITKLPYFGQFMNTVYLSQFTQAVGLLTSSKVPMVYSIELVEKMIPFYPLQQALKEVSKKLISGKSLSESLAEHKTFDDKMIALVKVAEETNQTAFIFERLHQQYTTRLQQQSKLLSTVMEPFIILFVGLVVGVILIAMYLPMFQLSTVMG